MLQAPLTSIVKRNQRYFVLVAGQRRWIPREVTVGADNDQRVVITSGLEPGEQVAVNPDSFVDDIDFPGGSPQNT